MAIEPLTPTDLNPAYTTPDQSQQLYKYATALMAPQTVNTGWGGIGEVARALIGGYLSHQADVQQQAARAYNQNQLTPTGGAATVGTGPPTTAPPIASSAPTSTASTGITPSANTPSSVPNPVSSYIVQAAAKRGIDPKVAMAIFNTESNLSPMATGDENSSFGVAQLHYGGVSKDAPNSGLGDAFTKTTGLDARDPSTWQKQIDFALDSAKTQGWKPWANTRDKLGIDNFTGIGPSPRPQPTQIAQNAPAYSGPQLGGVAANPWLPESIRTMALGLTQPKMMTDAVGNVSPTYQGQTTGAPVFRGGVLQQQGPNSVPAVVSGPVGAPTNTIAPPVVAGQPPIPPASPTMPPAAPGAATTAPAANPAAAVFGPDSPLGQMRQAQAATEAKANQTTQQAADWQKQYTEAQQGEQAARNASYPIHSLQAILDKNGGVLPTGEGAESFMKGLSLGNVIAAVTGHPIANEDDQLPAFELFRKYGNQLAAASASMGGNPTDLARNIAELSNPNVSISSAANAHLVDNMARLTDLSIKFNHDKAAYYRSNNGDLSGWNDAWIKSVSGPNAVPLSKYPSIVRTGSDGKTVWGKVPSTDPTGFTWRKLNPQTKTILE